VFGQPVDIKVGRFVTLVGTEVIESLDNWLPSRSLLFNNAIPFIHTGIRASRALPLFEDYATLTLGLNNGWDQALDNNDFKTVEGALTIENVVPKMSTTFAMLYGPEQGSPVTGAENGNKRGVITIINSYDVNDKLSISGEYDYGFEKQAVGASTTGRADWHGFAFYARYAFTEKFALSGRLEYFKDSDGARTGLEQSIWSYAIGADYWIYEDLLARLEFRQDLSNSDTFDANPDLTLVGTTDKQETIMGSLIYTF